MVLGTKVGISEEMDEAARDKTIFDEVATWDIGRCREIPRL